MRPPLGNKNDHFAVALANLVKKKSEGHTYCREGECDFGMLGDGTVRQTGLIWYFIWKVVSFVESA